MKIEIRADLHSFPSNSFVNFQKSGCKYASQIGMQQQQQKTAFVFRITKLFKMSLDKYLAKLQFEFNSNKLEYSDMAYVR